MFRLIFLLMISWTVFAQDAEVFSNNQITFEHPAGWSIYDSDHVQIWDDTGSYYGDLHLIDIVLDCTYLDIPCIPTSEDVMTFYLENYSRYLLTGRESTATVNGVYYLYGDSFSIGVRQIVDGVFAVLDWYSGAQDAGFIQVIETVQYKTLDQIFQEVGIEYAIPNPLDAGGWTLDTTTMRGIGSPMMFDLMDDSSYVMTSWGGLLELNPGGEILQVTTNKYWQNDVLDFAIAPDGRMWLVKDTGVYVFDADYHLSDVQFEDEAPQQVEIGADGTVYILTMDDDVTVHALSPDDESANFVVEETDTFFFMEDNLAPHMNLSRTGDLYIISNGNYSLRAFDTLGNVVMEYHEQPIYGVDFDSTNVPYFKLQYGEFITQDGQRLMPDVSSYASLITPDDNLLWTDGYVIYLQPFQSN